MTIVLALTLGLVGLAVCVVWEERGHREIVVLAVVGCVVLDALLYPSQGETPLGPLRVSLGGQDFRTADALVMAGLGARFLVCGFPRRVTGAGLLWVAFFGIFAFGAVVGVANDHETNVIVSQARFLLSGGGVAVLAAGVPASTWVRRRFVSTAATTLGVLAVFPIGTTVLGLGIAVPLLPGASYGFYGADAATIMASLGLILLFVHACDPQPRPAIVIWCAVLIAGPFSSLQRAALLGWVIAAVAAVALLVGPTWRRRSRTRASHMLLFLSALAIPLLVFTMFAARTTNISESFPVASRIDQAFGSTQKSQSEAIRQALWREGARLVEERPFSGWGLGKTFSVFQDNGSEEPLEGGDYHQLLLDVGVTTGLVGLAFFVAALAATLWSALATWRSRARPAVTALAAGAGIALLGLLAKGMVESITQKYRLAMLLGLLVGLVASAARTARSESTVTPRELVETRWS